MAGLFFAPRTDGHMYVSFGITVGFLPAVEFGIIGYMNWRDRRKQRRQQKQAHAVQIELAMAQRPGATLH